MNKNNTKIEMYQEIITERFGESYSEQLSDEVDKRLKQQG